VVGFDMACLGLDFDINGLGAQLAARCAVEVIGDWDEERMPREQAALAAAALHASAAARLVVVDRSR
jgi:hypothetical protein